MSLWQKMLHRAGRAREQPERPAAPTGADDADRRAALRRAQENANFWSYTGDPQPKIDESLLIPDHHSGR